MGGLKSSVPICRKPHERLSHHRNLASRATVRGVYSPLRYRRYRTMKHPESGQPRGTFLRGLLLSCVLATVVFALPSLASAQAPAEPAPPPPDTSTTTQAPSTTGGTQQTQPADTPQQPQTTGTPAQGAQPSGTPSRSKETPPIPQQDNPKVKAG